MKKNKKGLNFLNRLIILPLIKKYPGLDQEMMTLLGKNRYWKTDPLQMPVPDLNGRVYGRECETKRFMKRIRPASGQV